MLLRTAAEFLVMTQSHDMNEIYSRLGSIEGKLDSLLVSGMANIKKIEAIESRQDRIEQQHYRDRNIVLGGGGTLLFLIAMKDQLIAWLKI